MFTLSGDKDQRKFALSLRLNVIGLSCVHVIILHVRGTFFIGQQQEWFVTHLSLWSGLKIDCPKTHILIIWNRKVCLSVTKWLSFQHMSHRMDSHIWHKSHLVLLPCSARNKTERYSFVGLRFHGWNVLNLKTMTRMVNWTTTSYLLTDWISCCRFWSRISCRLWFFMCLDSDQDVASFFHI